jgi:hypothetical protein
MMASKLFSALVAAVMVMTITSCGSDDGAEDGSAVEDGGTDTDSETIDGSVSDFDESSLPDDFPTELIPSTYETGSYIDLGGTNTATFTNSVPIVDTIAGYKEAIGDPLAEVEGDEGQWSASWNHEGWVVSLVGGPDESIIGVSKVAG